MTKKNLEWKRINNFVSGMIYMRDFLNLKWSIPKKANTSADRAHDRIDVARASCAFKKGVRVTLSVVWEDCKGSEEQ